jgi:excisionase family DNA binding protein
MIDLLSLVEGAKELNLSIHTLRAWTYQKKIPFVRLGRRILLRREDLENLVKKNLIEAKSQG